MSKELDLSRDLEKRFLELTKTDVVPSPTSHAPHEQALELVRMFCEKLKGPIDVRYIEWPGKQRHADLDLFLARMTELLRR